MNYLQLINHVLRRLREEEVSSVYENRQSSVVADFLNDSKQLVEDSFDWHPLRKDIPFSTVATFNNYSLPGSQNRAKILDVRDTTNNAWLRRVSSEYIRRQELIANVGVTRPTYYASEGNDANGDNIIKLWPTPDGAYILRAYVVQRTPDLVAEGDRILVPSQPIIMMAYAMSAEERGDVKGEALESLYGRAKRSLGDAIMHDAGKAPEEMQWYPE